MVNMKKIRLLFILSGVVSSTFVCAGCAPEDPKLTALSVSTYPLKTTYEVGDMFDKTGMVVTGTYSNGSTREVNNYTYVPDGALELSDNMVVISSQEILTVLPITVLPKQKEAALTGIEISTMPTKLEYVVGETFDPTGMVIVAKYTDGSQNIINNYSYSPTGKLSVSDNKVVVSYMGKTVDVSINVSKKVVRLENITITHQPNKVDYYVGDYFQTTGLRISASYSDGSSKEVTGWSYDKTDKLTLDDTAVVISYTEGDVTKTISIKISVTEVPEPVELLNIAVTQQPNKVDYYVGEHFDPTGMEVTAYYDDGSEKIVTDYQYTPQGALSLIDKNITIGYEDKATTLPITVTQGSSKYQTGIEIVTPPTKTEYKVGEYFDKTGMVVKSTYNDGTGETITNYTYSPSGALTLDDKFLTVKSGTFEAKQSITVTKEDVYLAAIYVKTQPNKTTYVAGENFNKTGMVVMAAYSDGSSKEITDYTISPETNLKTTDTKITISFQGKTATVNITVTQQEEGYYAGIDVNSSTLLQDLNSLNSKKRKSTVGYSAMLNSPSTGFYVTDPGTGSNTITTFYSGKNNNGTGGLNREHVWPKSHGGNLVENDIHMPRPTLNAENGSRGNSFYVEGKCHSSNGWDPAMESFGLESYRGDSARIIFYCAIANLSLTLVDLEYHSTSNSNRDNMMGKLTDLLRWNLKYPVLERELIRNDGAESLQGNRNPFIDHPEYACKIWGTVNSETRKICGIN